MELENNEILKETFELAKENNKMLRKVRGVQKRQFFWSILKILIVIGIALGSFYFLEPYVNKMMDLYSSISGTGQKVNNIPIQDLLKKL